MRKSSAAKGETPPSSNSSRAAAAAATSGPPIAPERNHKLEPDEMSDEMVPADLVFVLEHLEFRGSRAVLKSDRGVRDFLIRRLARHAPRAV
jgi:hypothetical protein